MTLRNLERGNTGVTLGACLAVMQVLGVEQDLNLLLKDDPFGRQLQDATLIPRKPISRNSRSKRTPSSAPSESPSLKSEETDTETDWARDDFLSAGSLASLLQEGEDTGKKTPKRTKK
ncbi:hypothetical protein EDF78_104249 [Rahnella sp. BIGb0236]|nr:hypothetical protein EDF78_104249 [Rahnella sp. BIGb0236]